jgi:hypothetical protein
MGSFRFRKSVRLAPGVRLNIGKKSIGVSAGVRGARHSVSSSGRPTTTVGIPGSGLSYQHRHPNQGDAEAIPGTGIPSPTRLLASAVGWLAILGFAFAVFGGSPNGGGTMAAYGILAYIALRLLRPVLDPMIVWALTHRP